MAAAGYPNKILVVDSDRSIGKGVDSALKKYDIKVDVAADRETAVYLYNQNIYPVILIEVDFPDTPGLVMLQKFRSSGDTSKDSCGVILLAGSSSGTKSKQLKLLEEIPNVQMANKPLNHMKLLSLLQKAFANRNGYLKSSELHNSICNLAKGRKGPDRAIQLARNNAAQLGVKALDVIIDVLSQAERWSEALEFIETQLDKKPSNTKLLNDKSKILLKQGKTAEALKIMEVLDKAAPNNIERINRMAQVYLEVQQPDNSVVKMREMIDFHPEDENMKFSLFSKLSSMGYDQHAAHLCRDTASPTEVVRHYNNKGVALSKEGNIEGAIIEYERSLKFYPKFKLNYKIMYNLALALATYKTSDQHQNALEYLEKCLQLSPDYEKAQKTMKLIEIQIVKLRALEKKAS